MPFTIVCQDITDMKVDAVVNAANVHLQMGSGVCGAIFRAAGEKELQEACNRMAPIQTGEAVITPGFRLRAAYIIHTAGPVYTYSEKEKNAALLRSAYMESLKLAAAKGCSSIAFPLISSGIYGYPKEEALQVATRAITDFLDACDMDVYLAVLDRADFPVCRQLIHEVDTYINEQHETVCFFGISHAEKSSGGEARASRGVTEGILCDICPDTKEEAVSVCEEPTSLSEDYSLEDIVSHLDEPFADMLLRIIDSKGKTDAEVYKKANIDRRLFSKIRSVKGYTPKKKTILALAVALELTLDETEELLSRAGYAFSRASKFDVIVAYFIVHGKYNLYDINEVLFIYDQPLLGA